MDREADDRQSRFKRTLAFFRTLSESSNGDSAYSSSSDLALPSPDQTNQLGGFQDDGNSTHWAAMWLCQFLKNGGFYVDLIRSQVGCLVKCGCWDQHKDFLRFATIRAYVSGISSPLYLLPSSDTGDLYCTKQQMHAGPYQPACLNGLEVNYVLYNENQQFNPENLRMAIFSPKYQPNYALRVIQDSQSADGRFDVKFIECETDFHFFHCQPTGGGLGPYNISVTAYKELYWLCLDEVDSRMVVKAFKASLANPPPKAEFEFMNILLHCTNPQL